HQPGQIDPVHHRDGGEDGEQAATQRGNHHDDEEQVGKGVHDVGEAHQQVVDAATVIARGEPDGSANQQHDDLHHQAYLDGDLCAGQDTGQNIPSEVVGAQGMGQAGRGKDDVQVLLEGIAKDRQVEGVSDGDQD